MVPSRSGKENKAKSGTFLTARNTARRAARNGTNTEYGGRLGRELRRRMRKARHEKNTRP
jgi:hypothetical protein